MVSWGFESPIFCHGSSPMCGVRQAERQAKPRTDTRYSKHNWYCNGLLIRSSTTVDVQVRVLPVPPMAKPAEGLQMPFKTLT